MGEVITIDFRSCHEAVAIRADFAALLRLHLVDDALGDEPPVAIRADFAALLRLVRRRASAVGRAVVVAIRADFAALLRPHPLPVSRIRGSEVAIRTECETLLKHKPAIAGVLVSEGSRSARSAQS